ncbi:MAG TPA: hypothetical protein VFE74_05080 [Ramlibacter sp.]|nr:hypothetical protein [Ramlibacter sp.]
MRYQAFVHAAAGALAAAVLTSGVVVAQTTDTVPQPSTMTDTEPLPAHDRASAGAIILMEEPVLAQREMMQAAQERSAVDTRSMGAGPARLLERMQLQRDTQDKEPATGADKAVSPR